MKHLLAIIAIIALFAISCNKNESVANTGAQGFAKNAQTLLKGAPEDEGEEDTELVDEENPTEDEVVNEGDEETTGEEELDEEEPVEGEEEPAEETPVSPVEAFVATHFPETAIASGCEEEEGHSIKLADGTHIIFDSNLEWKRVNCKHSTVYTFVPESIVPEAITAYVVENNPEQTIMDIKKVGFGYMVTLNNNGKIKFNKDFTIK